MVSSREGIDLIKISFSSTVGKDKGGCFTSGKDTRNIYQFVNCSLAERTSPSRQKHKRAKEGMHV